MVSALSKINQYYQRNKDVEALSSMVRMVHCPKG